MVKLNRQSKYEKLPGYAEWKPYMVIFYMGIRHWIFLEVTHELISGTFTLAAEVVHNLCLNFGKQIICICKFLHIFRFMSCLLVILCDYAVIQSVAISSRVTTCSSSKPGPFQEHPDTLWQAWETSLSKSRQWTLGSAIVVACWFINETIH